MSNDDRPTTEQIAEVMARAEDAKRERAEHERAERNGQTDHIPPPAEPDEPPDPGPPDDEPQARGHRSRKQEPPADEPEADRAVDGAKFILDIPDTLPALWGDGSDVLWAKGEPVMIAGTQGLGKTPIAGQLVRALLFGGDVLGLPVTAYNGVILYLAMDRPRQIARSMRRQFSEDDRATLAAHLIVRPGPPPADLAKNPILLAGLAEHYNAGIVFIDSLKDAAIGLSEDEVAAAYNRGRQYLLAASRELCELHHTVKRGQRTPTAADIYGSTWLTSGCGSIILLTGEPGDPIIGFRHVKQPGDEVGPWRLLHNQRAGRLTIEHNVYLPELADVVGGQLTAKQAAAAIYDNDDPSRAQIQKALRRLNALVPVAFTRVEGAKGGSKKTRRPTRWILNDRVSELAADEDALPFDEEPAGG
jgi:hypothetical protein